MNLNKFISKNIFKQLIILYVLSIALFVVIRLFDFYRESSRFYTLTKNYINNSTEQLINEGDILRLQMNIDQFLSVNNKENVQIICPKVFLEKRMIASVECNGVWSYEKVDEVILSNGQILRIEFRMDGSRFIYNNILIIFFFSIVLIFVFFQFKKSIDEFSIQITSPLLKWSEWAKNINFNKDFETPHFTNEELEITEFENFHKFNQKAFELQKDFFQSKILEEKAKVEIELAKSLSHDIRSPIMALKNMENEITFASKDSESYFFSTVSRVENIANDLLRKSSRLNIQESFSNQLRALIKEKMTEFKNDQINLNLQIEDVDLKLLPSTQQKMLRIVSNLVNNAIESQLREKRIDVALKYSIENQFLKIEIIDLGPGIPIEIQKSIGQISISSKELTNQSGTGIGLLNAYKFINGNSGKIQFTTGTSGTHFTILFPYKPKEVVLVDDDKLTHLFWKKESMKKGIKLFAFYNREEIISSLSLFSKNTPIFIDFRLGDSNGIELAHELNQLGYEKLYIQSGEGELETPDFVIDVISKIFPF
jgi:signal transduction histidine kinase